MTSTRRPSGLPSINEFLDFYANPISRPVLPVLSAMNAYELQREANIRKNQALLRGLQLPTIPTPRRARDTDSKQAAKRRKLDNLPARTRSSARISAAPKPNYNEDVKIEPLRRTGGSTKPQRASAVKEAEALSTLATSPAQPSQDEAAAIANDWKWQPTAPLPTRHSDQTLHFPDYPDFTPNKTPAEMLREGCLGGCYFRPFKSRKLGMVIENDWQDDIPTEWIDGLDVDRFLTGRKNGYEYDAEVNKYGVAAGQGIEEWEAAGWISHTHDPRGWFQWYIRFYQGRRCDDDARQVSRWKKCVGPTGRWRRILLKKYVQMGIREVFDYGDGDEDEPGRDVSPVVHQTCHHWAYEVRQEDLERFWRTGM